MYQQTGGLCGTVYQDTAKIYPTRLLEDVSIKIIDLQEKLLSTYDRRIAEYTTAGAYPRSLFSSTGAVSDTHKTPYTP